MIRTLEVQKALYDRLRTNPGIAAAVTGVYDHVPQGSAYPYIVIGEGTEIREDTQTFTGTSIDVVIHCWSRVPGRYQTKYIQSLIYDALHRLPLTLSSGRCWETQFLLSDSLLEPDGETRQGVQRFRINTVR